MCDVVNSSSSSSTVTSSSVPSSINHGCSVSESVCATSAALITGELNDAARPADDVIHTRTDPVNNALHLQTMAAGRNMSECQQTQQPFPTSHCQTSTDADRKSVSSLPINQEYAAAESQKTQLSVPPSQAFPVTGHKSQSSVMTGEAFAVADTRNSLPSCMSNYSSMETGDIHLPYSSVDTPVASQMSTTSRDAVAVQCKSAVVNASASVSRVCITCCIISLLVLHHLLLFKGMVIFNFFICLSLVAERTILYNSSK